MESVCKYVQRVTLARRKNALNVNKDAFCAFQRKFVINVSRNISCIKTNVWLNVL